MDEILATLKSVDDKIHAEFTGPGSMSRVEQFDAHLKTVKMVVECLYDEATRMENYK